MSRLGKLPISIPEGVEVILDDKQIIVKGPKGTLTMPKPAYVMLTQQDKEVSVTIPEKKKSDKIYKSFHGLVRSLIANMVTGVHTGYKKELEMKGIGYRALLQGDTLVLHVGYSHPVEIAPIEGITFQVSENVNIAVEGIDKQLVGQVAANIRKVRKPEPYKGKGIRYKGEIVRKKSGKSGKAAGKEGK